MDKQQMIDLLNRDLANEFQAILAYTQWSARATGPHRPQVRALFQSEIPDEQGHAQFLADKIVSMGGVPTTQAAAIPQTGSNRAMLEAALAAEEEAIRNYTERADQAGELGDLGLKVQLENMVADETHHAEELRLLLNGWTDAG